MSFFQRIHPSRLLWTPPGMINVPVDAASANSIIGENTLNKNLFESAIFASGIVGQKSLTEIWSGSAISSVATAGQKTASLISGTSNTGYMNGVVGGISANLTRTISNVGFASGSVGGISVNLISLLSATSIAGATGVVQAAGWMHVQGNSTALNNGTLESIQCIFPGSVTPGNLIIVSVAFYSYAQTQSVSDNINSQAYTYIGKGTFTNLANLGTWWYVVPPGGGGTNFTVTFSQSPTVYGSYSAICIDEYNVPVSLGFAISLAASQFSSGTSLTPQLSQALPVSQSSLVYSAICNETSGATASSAGTGFQLESNLPNVTNICYGIANEDYANEASNTVTPFNAAQNITYLMNSYAFAVVPAPTTATLSGPPSGPNGEASTPFTITLDNPVVISLSFPVSSSGSGDVLTPSTVIISSGTTGTFTVTPGSSGNRNITLGVGTTGLTIINSPRIYNSINVPPSTATLSGPSSGFNLTASTPFTVTLNHPAITSLSFPVSSNGSGDVLIPPAVTININSMTGTFTVTPGSTGNRNITLNAGSTGLSIIGSPWVYNSLPVAQMQLGQDNPYPDPGTGVSLGGWSWGSVPGTWWAEMTRDVSNDPLSPYNSNMQAMFQSYNAYFQASWYASTAQGKNTIYSQFASYVAGTQPLVPYSFKPGGYTTSDDPPTFCLFASQREEGWPRDANGSYGHPGISATVGSNIVTGTGFISQTAIVAGSTVVLGVASPSVLYTVASVDSDTQLTLTTNFTGPLVTDGYGNNSIYGPYNKPPNSAQWDWINNTGTDTHIMTLMRNESTGQPGKLWESYGDYSPNADGSSWLVQSVAYWDLTTPNFQRKDNNGSTGAGGFPFFPGMVRYEEVLNNTGNIAYYGVMGADLICGDRSVASSNYPWVWPALHASAAYGGSYQSGYPPYGARLRLNAAWYNANSGSFSPLVRNILYRLVHYGVLIADATNGFRLQLNGIGDGRWLQSDLDSLMYIPMSQMEMIDTVKPQMSLTGPTTGLVHGQTYTYTAAYLIQANKNFSSTLHILYSPDGGSTWISLGDRSISSANYPSSYQATFTFTPPSTGTYLIAINFIGQDTGWILPDPLSVNVSS